MKEHNHLTFNLSDTGKCDCKGRKDYTLNVRHKVAITPDGADDPLPVIGTVAVNAAALDTAIEVFDELFEDYEDMLVAAVANMSVSDVLDTVDRGDWQWNQSTKRYRNTESGRIITENTLIGMRDDLVDNWRVRVQDLADDLVEGRLTVQEWTLRMRREVSNIFSDEYLLAKGGRNAMFQYDIDALSDMIRSQHGFLQNFAEEVRAGDLSKAQISARSELYMESATQAHERGKGSRHDILLPYYPADGSQICRSRCKCRWDIDESEEEVTARWLLSVQSTHCDTCLSNAAADSLVFSKG